MQVMKTVFDLGDQWPMRRNRFWCLMIADDLPPLRLSTWPSCPSCTRLGGIRPLDALWPDEHEHDLQWDDHELAIYFDPQFGNDLRILQSDHRAPTALHSWAHLLRACPCGCRMLPFTMQRLQHGGAIGFGILSGKTAQVRHLHPEEGALLCTVPLDYNFVGTPRSALCLLGQIAAPLQVLWLLSQLVSHLQEHFCLH